ncbi:5-methyltetrahydropteroyltriglutamate--homocysteine methyltransferase [Gordonia hirsuta DSM 44140 = NBRC 16056]|uniref:5-methyltetrahydropteroyltriglutamate--homocysteine methyltransferase n=1 Tax=Gordonia hirsuta DSM 44140 = NBRC 16056 TaxID=1121927 RepID=L7L7I7_9ACTN|nr:5-methyltetrahydropteroyltriglutamate--homocysteine S-methyltransferase [Gordonia hirsuta]GAC56726.1 5-methyltetrahydropteroyltriglutamate--homocysteine methyltransferase [Gordonia hirsuta DSM 44140 = NBRC 16056]
MGFTTTVPGTARIGADRELKRAVEGYWAGLLDATELEAVAEQLRRTDREQLIAAGLDSIPVNTFSYYDQMLDAAVMLGALPPRVAGIADPLDRYFAAARGAEGVTPLEMTKWFDTNYHYLVPEIGPATSFALDTSKVLAELAEATDAGAAARPVVIGPVTFLGLSKAVDGGAQPLSRIDELLPLYEQLLTELATTGAQWVQLDEPILVTDAHDGLPELAERVYTRIAGATDRPKILVQTYFGDAGAALAALGRTGVEGIGADLVEGSVETIKAAGLGDKLVVAGVVDGHNVWRTDLDAALATLTDLREHVGELAVGTSCSTLHVPYTLAAEDDLDPALRGWLAFAAEKFDEVAALAGALAAGRESQATAFDAARDALASRATDPRLHVAAVRDRLGALTAADRARGEATARRAAQHEALALPPLPTTTIGSFPQTGDIRKARQQLRQGQITAEQYREQMETEIAEVIALQEQIGLDVLVHGEPERNDMVQYFAEQLTGFFATANGWVQSYGSRCVRPPILFGDVARPTPMTVGWITHAQSLTGKIVKGMLTGPVTILAWSFVRDDQPLAQTADQVALAIRDETVDLERAGVGIIQVDEPALRELLPLRSADRQAYLDWAVGAFKLSTSGVADETQIHTHLCYSEFGDVIGAIADLDADVTSIEAARSHMEVLDDLNAIGFSNEVGPGVYDIHSPRIPGAEEMTTLLREALAAVPAERVWVNPDCGLKTRTTEQVTAALTAMVEAAKAARAQVEASA